MYYSKRAILQNHGKYLIEHMVNFSSEEHALIEAIMHKITPEDLNLAAKASNKVLSFGAQELYELKLLATPRSIEQVMRKLLSRYIVMRELTSGNSRMIPLFVQVNYCQQELRLEIPPVYINLILDIKNKHPHNRWRYAMKMKISNAAALYMVLQRYTGAIEFTLPELKNHLSLEQHYAKYSNFKKNVLVIGKEEINCHTDIAIEFEEIFEARKVSAVKFFIEPNPQL